MAEMHTPTLQLTPETVWQCANAPYLSYRARSEGSCIFSTYEEQISRLEMTIAIQSAETGRK